MFLIFLHAATGWRVTCFDLLYNKEGPKEREIRAKRSQKLLVSLQTLVETFNVAVCERGERHDHMTYIETNCLCATSLLWFWCICHNKMAHGMLYSLSSRPAAAQCFQVSSLCGWSSSCGGRLEPTLREGGRGGNDECRTRWGVICDEIQIHSFIHYKTCQRFMA